MKNFERLLFAVGFFFLAVQSASAVPPPDFLFNIGAGFVQVFSVIVLFLGAIIAAARRFAGVYFIHFKNNKVVWGVLVLIVIGVAVGGTYYYSQYKQDMEYDKWVEESEAQSENMSITDLSFDKLKIDEVDEASAEEEVAVQAVVSSDIAFIQNYYSNLGSGKIEEAYAVSKKSVDLETYKSWYSNITALNINDIQKIDDDSYSLRLILEEGEDKTSYAVLMTLEEANGGFKVHSSDVRILNGAVHTAEAAAKDDIVFEKNIPLSISNEEFRKIASSEIFVLDAREDEEYDIGRFNGSEHIRFADLIAGEWIRVPTDQAIYVFCWSGVRGKEVAEFLRTKKIAARYVENGANGWVASGGSWDGDIKFLSKYPEERYKRLVTIGELKKAVEGGATVVDSRPKAKYDAWHIPGSINIPIIYTPSIKIGELLALVPSGKSVITVCDDFVSCFDAKITGLKLEREGHEFIGRYNKPWEYRSLQ
jgi:rhodanese-related sulfurtransferase